MSNPAIPSYPDDAIPLTDRHWRERWAQELTRANQLEHKLRQAERDRDDWQRIALQNGEDRARAEVARERATTTCHEWIARSTAAEHTLARVEADLALLQPMADRMRAERDALLDFARGAMSQWFEAVIENPASVIAREMDWMADWMVDRTVGDELTTECDECGGDCRVADYVDRFDPSTSHGHYEIRVESECGACVGGRVAVEAS